MNFADIYGFTSITFDWALGGGTGRMGIGEFSSIQAVPVPAAVWLFGSGLIGLNGIARRKKA